MRIGIVCDNRCWNDPCEPFRHVAEGLRRLGHAAEAVAPAGPWPLMSRRPDAMFVWNGLHGRWAAVVEHCRAEGIAVLIMERGFFDRRHYTQIDPCGFNHTAGWATEVAPAAPAGGAERFLRASGRKPERTRETRSGYILVLCQMPGDAQLQSSALRHPGPWVQAMEDASPTAVEIRVRAHPLSAWSCGTIGRARMIRGTLEEALRGAAFAATINSNAGNEALAWGCPVLCLGPALYGMAGVALQTKLAALPRAVCQMLWDGWHPARRDVENYLYRLACRQWSHEELAEGSVLKRFLAAADAASA